jgi:hypothetical protein
MGHRFKTRRGNKCQMKQRKIVLALTLLAAGLLHAQGFQLQYGGDRLQDAVGTVNDATGFSTVVRDASETGAKVQIKLLRTTLNGLNAQWFDVAIPGTCFVQAVIASGDGNILLCGSCIAPGRSDQDALVAKISNTGAVLWTWTSNDPLNEEELRGLERTADNGLIACGTFRGGPDSQALLVRISPSGTLQWNQQYGTGGDDALNGVALMDNGFMAAGRVANFSGDVDAYVLAVDLNGSELWWQSWGGIKPDLFNGIARSGANFYLAGRTDSFGPLAGGQHVRSTYLMAMDQAGDTLWTRTFGDVAAANTTEGIHKASNGDLVLVGQTGNANLTDGMAMRVNTSGTQLWQRSYPIDNEDVLHDLTLLDDGGFVAPGRSFGAVGYQAILVRKNSLGL